MCFLSNFHEPKPKNFHSDSPQIKISLNLRKKYLGLCTEHFKTFLGNFNQKNCMITHFIQAIPFVYCLLSNKKKVAYEAVFRYINDHLGITEGLKCKTLMADYEIAMTDGFLAVVPSATVSHCHFHFAQAVKRNAQKCSVLQNYLDSYVKTSTKPQKFISQTNYFCVFINFNYQ